MTDTIEQNARALIALRRNAGAGAQPPAPQTLDDAYRTQFAIERSLGAEHGFAPIGWKIGATNAGARGALKLEAPFLGRLYRQMSSEAPAQVAAAPGFFRAYEAEIALIIGRDLDPAQAPLDAAAIRAATRAIAPAIEIVGGYLPPGGLSLIADFAGNAHWIVGGEIADFATLDLMEAPITLAIDGETKATGKGAAVEGGAFGATAWLANELAKLGLSLKAGDYVTTGTAIAPSPCPAGAHVAVADFGALGRVEVKVG